MPIFVISVGTELCCVRNIKKNMKFVILLIGFLSVSYAVSPGIYGLSSSLELISVNPSTGAITNLMTSISNELEVNFTVYS